MHYICVLRFFLYFSIWKNVLFDFAIIIYSLLYNDKKDKFYNPTLLPYSINYKIDITRLHQKLTFKKGILVECEYFENLEITSDSYGLYVYNYSKPVLKVLMTYYVSNNSYVDSRIVKRYWTYDDYTYSTDYKESIKYYDIINSKNEGDIRRSNIINDCITSIGGLLLITEPTITNINEAEIFALPLLDNFGNEINKYLKGNIQPLLTKASTIDVTTLGYTENWFDNIIPGAQMSIRQFLISKAMEGVLNPNEIIEL